MLVIIGVIAFVQYYTSDKLALAAAGAKVVERDEAPDLHDMVERLCAMADLPKPTHRRDGHARAERLRDRPLAEARRRLRDDGTLAPPRAAGDRGRARPRALAHREPRRADDDDRELLRHARRLHHPHVPVDGDVRRVRRRQPRQQQRPAGLADRPVRVDRRLRDQLRPDPDALALPRVRGRPRLRADHRRARAPDERPAEDLVADDADPAAGPPPGRGHERVLHHPGEGRGMASELFMDHPPIEKRLAALAEIAREMGRPVS